MRREHIMATIEVVRIDDVRTSDLQAPAPILVVHDKNGVGIVSTVHNNVCFNDECVICFEDIKSLQDEGNDVVVFKCLHQLCRKCAVEYFKSQLKSGMDITCPVCRSVLMHSWSTQYQAYHHTYYSNGTRHVQSNDRDYLPIRTQIQLQHERWQGRRAVAVQAPRITFKRLMLSTPCLIIVLLIFTPLALYQSGAL